MKISLEKMNEKKSEMTFHYEMSSLIFFPLLEGIYSFNVLMIIIINEISTLQYTIKIKKKIKKSF